MTTALPTLTQYSEQVFHSLNECQVTDRYEHPIDRERAEDTVREWLLQAQEQRKKVFVIGNGGSAAIASHMQNDLHKANGIRALVLTETPLLTAYTNDEGYERAYSQQIELWAESGDLLVAISSSGQSENILRAVSTAQRLGVRAVTLSGFSSENTLRRCGDLNFYIPANSYGTVELAHAVLCHYLSDSFSHVHQVATVT